MQRSFTSEYYTTKVGAALTGCALRKQQLHQSDGQQSTFAGPDITHAPEATAYIWRRLRELAAKFSTGTGAVWHP